jgi:hypothetical protein
VRSCGWSDVLAMPLLRYFVFVGGALLALLLISNAYFTNAPDNAYLPKTPDEVRAADSGFDRSTIRILSETKWPERVVFDTNQPTIVPVRAAGVIGGVQAPARVADVSAKAQVREAFAQVPPSDHTQAQLSDPKKPEKPVQRKRKIAKRHPGPPVMMVAQQPQFSLFGNNTW